jgi:hypothetical protein
MAELRGRVRDRLRERLLRHGASQAFDDPALFAEVEGLLQTATLSGDSGTLVLAELLGDPDTWRLDTAMRYQSHRGAAASSIIVFIKRRLLMPMLRWLFEYSRDNFERQRRVNQVLFACVQELAIETASLRRQLRGGAAAPGLSASAEGYGEPVSAREVSGGGSDQPVPPASQT